MQSSDIEKLRQFTNAISPLPDPEWQAFSSGWQELTVKRKTILTIAGETERYLYFVTEGVQRAFFHKDDGREATIVFTYAPSFSGIADSFLTQTASLYFLETHRARRCLRMHYDRFNELFHSSPVLQSFFFSVTAMALKGALMRHVELQCYTNEEKFRELLRRSPHILQLVPHKYLASYLGMDPTNFSKLINQVRI